MKQIAIISLGIALAAQALINVQLCRQREQWKQLAETWEKASNKFEQECMKAQAIARECIEIAKQK